MDLLSPIASAGAVSWHLLPCWDFNSCCLAITGEASSSQQVKQPPFRNVMGGWCGSCSALSGRGETQQPLVLPHGGTEHAGRFSSQHCHRFPGQTCPGHLKLSVVEPGLLCCVCSTSSFLLHVKTDLGKALKSARWSREPLFGEQECICVQCLFFRMSSRSAGFL